MMSNEEIRLIFLVNHLDADQADRINTMCEKFCELALVLNANLPDGPGKTVAIRKLSEARMQANTCIALGGKF